MREGDGGWLIVTAAAGCPHGHLGGERGYAEGAPARVTGVGECVTVVFDSPGSGQPSERHSRTAMLLTPDEKTG